MLCGSILGIIISLYFVLGFSLDILVDRVSLETERKLAEFFSRKFYLSKDRSDAEKATQKIVDDLAGYLPETSYKFSVHIVSGKEANAFALPGGNILVNTALIDEVGSENELVMVLAHELGHYMHRDHLRGLGRGLALTVMSVFLFGNNSDVTQFLMRALLTTDLRFSRKQEAFADVFALGLLYKRYGHAAGATDFFQHATKKKRYPRFLKYFSTHPHDSERISMLHEEIVRRGYKIAKKVPLDSSIRGKGQ